MKHPYVYLDISISKESALGLGYIVGSNCH